MTPFELDILLHYYSSSSEHEAVRNNVPAWADTREMFSEEGLIRAIDNGRFSASYELTDRGKCYIEHILSLQLPTQIWSMTGAVDGR